MRVCGHVCCVAAVVKNSVFSLGVLKYVCLCRDVMDIVFPVCIIRGGAISVRVLEYSNTSAHPLQATDLVNLTPCKISSSSSKFPKAKHYRKRTIPPKLTALSKLRNKSQTPSIKTVTLVALEHTVTNNNSSTENILNTKLNSNSNTFSIIKTVCHCDDPNFKLFREIHLDSHPIVIKTIMINRYSLYNS